MSNHAYADILRADFSEPERQRLQSGELISRPISQQHGAQKLFGGTSWQIINAPADTVWRAINNVAYYPQMLPKAVAARTLRTYSNRKLVWVRHQGGPFDVNYELLLEADSQTRDLQFKLRKSSSPTLQEVRGFIHVSTLDAARSVLAFGIVSDIGSGSFQSFARPLLQKKMLKMPFYIKRHIEQTVYSPANKYNKAIRTATPAST